MAITVLLKSPYSRSKILDTFAFDRGDAAEFSHVYLYGIAPTVSIALVKQSSLHLLVYSCVHYKASHVNLTYNLN